MTTSPCRIVVADANVLINLVHIGRLEILGALSGHEFLVPDDVREEITNPGQRVAIDDALVRGLLGIVQVTDLADVALFADLRARLGRGESACLALAQHHGWTVASDERGRFRREAERRVGVDRIIGTAAILLLAIRGGHLTIIEADSDKQVLETRRFRMPFASFSELVEAAGQGEP